VKLKSIIAKIDDELDTPVKNQQEINQPHFYVIKEL